MKTTNLLWTVCILLTVGFAVVAAALRGIYDDNRRLLTEIHTLRTDSQRAAEEIKQLENRKADLAAELASKRDPLPEAQTEPAEARETNTRTNEFVVSPSTPRPVKVRTFLDNRYVGMSWLAPSGVSKDPKTGAVTYEPVVVLDETVKQSLVVYQTNVVEREVARSTTVNYNYPWPGYYPVFFAAGTNRATHRNPRQIPGTPPPIQLPPQNPKPLPNAVFRTLAHEAFLPAVNQTLSPPSQNRSTWSGAFQPQNSPLIDFGRKLPAVWVPPGS